MSDEKVPTIIEHNETLPSTELVDTQGPTEKDIDDDYERVRGNLGDIAETGAEALDGALELATETEHPRAYEVVGQIMKTLTDTNLAMLDLHQKVKNIKRREEGDKTEVTNNNLVVSTADIQKMLAGKKQVDKEWFEAVKLLKEKYAGAYPYKGVREFESKTKDIEIKFNGNLVISTSDLQQMLSGKT